MKPAISESPHIGRAAFGADEHARASAGQLVLHPQLADPLRRAGFRSLDETLALDGEVVSEHRRTRVLLLAASRELPAIYLKVHRTPDRKDVLFSLMRHGEARSSAETEWRNLEDLAAVGIQTPVPLAMGCRMHVGRERVSFLATAALGGLRPLDELAPELDAPRRARALALVAGTVARMHAAGFTHPDLYARHVYADDVLRTCALIDVQRTRRISWLTAARRARDLAALDVSLPPRLVSRGERLRFLVRYRRCAGAAGGALPRRTVGTIARRIRRRRALLVKRGRGEEWKQERLSIAARTVDDGRLYVNPAREALVAELDLASVARAFEPEFARLLRSLPDRDNGIVRTSAGLVFLKRHRPGSGPPPGILEWDNTWRLAAGGIPAAEPVCAGVDHAGRSFLLTVGIEGEPLDDCLRRGRPSEPTIRELTGELAVLTARMHAAGLCHRDYYLCHVFVRPDSLPGDKLVLIDLQRVMDLGRWRASRWRLKDLAALAWSAVGLPVTDRERVRFARIYTKEFASASDAARTRVSLRRLLGQIERRVAGLLRRHGEPLAPAPRDPELRWNPEGTS